MTNTISLMTDFGLKDQYVGVMKSVIVKHNPSSVIIDITHEINPQDINQAKFLTRCSYDYFPPKAVHVIVVDPDVGTERKIFILETPGAYFIAPDNGVLSEIVKHYRPHDLLKGGSYVDILEPCYLYELDKEQFWNNPLSNTFHGRDIFAPVAAILSKEKNPEDLGTLSSKIYYDPLQSPIVSSEEILGTIIYVDRFGNLVSNIEEVHIDRTRPLEIHMSEICIEGLSDTFKQPTTNNDFIALFGSHGHLEIAKYKEDASRSSNIGEGTKITVQYR